MSFMALALCYGYKTAFRRITSADLYMLFYLVLLPTLLAQVSASPPPVKCEYLVML